MDVVVWSKGANHALLLTSSILLPLVDDPLRRTPLPHYELALRCLGAVVFYLRYCLADTEILSLGLIREYRPVDGGSTCTAGAAPSNGSYAREPFYDRQVNMVRQCCPHSREAHNHLIHLSDGPEFV